MDEHRRPETGSWREQLLLTLAHWGALFGGVIAIGVTIRALAFDFVDVSHPAFAAMFVGYGAIVALRLLPGLPYRVRAVTLSAACFIAAGSAVLLRGLAPAPVLLLGLGVLIAALFLGRAGMLGRPAACGSHRGASSVARNQPEAFSPWSSAIDVVCVAGVLTVLVQFVVSRLERSLDAQFAGTGTPAGGTGAARARAGPAHAGASDAATNAKARRGRTAGRWCGSRLQQHTASGARLDRVAAQ